MEHVYNIIALLTSIYPLGIDDEDYPEIIALLKKDISEQNLATLLSHVLHKEVCVVQKDIVKYQDVDVSTRVRNKFIQAGYTT